MLSCHIRDLFAVHLLFSPHLVVFYFLATGLPLRPTFALHVLTQFTFSSRLPAVHFLASNFWHTYWAFINSIIGYLIPTFPSLIYSTNICSTFLILTYHPLTRQPFALHLFLVLHLFPAAHLQHICITFNRSWHLLFWPLQCSSRESLQSKFVNILKTLVVRFLC